MNTDLESLARKKGAERIILDMGSSADVSRQMKGSISVDMDKNANPDIVYDLNDYPYPFNDASVDAIHMSHCLEHLDDPVRFLEEAYRILKHDGTLIIKVPHFSSATSFASLVHKHHFGVTTFKSQYSPNYKFDHVSVKLNYCAYRNTAFRKLINSPISALANLNTRFCERVWCYWVGGFSEIEFVLRKV
jgi:predicted SAM-dependent methyltransferase